MHCGVAVHNFLTDYLFGCELYPIESRNWLDRLTWVEAGYCDLDHTTGKLCPDISLGVLVLQPLKVSLIGNKNV